MTFTPVGQESNKRSIPDITTYWQNKELSDDDKDINKGSISTYRIMPEYDGFIYSLKDNPGLRRGTGSLSTKEVTIKTISYGLMCLNVHPVFGPMVDEIIKLHHDISTTCSMTRNKRVWLSHKLQLEEHPYEKYRLFVGSNTKGFIDDSYNALGMSKYVLSALLFYLALEKYNFAETNPKSDFLNSEVSKNINLIQDMLLDRLAILRAFSKEFFV